MLNPAEILRVEVKQKVYSHFGKNKLLISFNIQQWVIWDQCNSPYVMLVEFIIHPGFWDQDSSISILIKHLAQEYFNLKRVKEIRIIKGSYPPFNNFKRSKRPKM